MIYSLGSKQPLFRGEYFILPGAIVIGDVDVGHNVNIWFNAVIRADNDTITLGDSTNIQDGCVLHVDPGVPLTIGKNVVVGHKAMLHGCSIGDNSLIGINAVILNGAKVGKNCLIGSNCLITENKVIPDGSLVMGSPGKVIRKLTDQELQLISEGAQHYCEKAKVFRDQLKPVNLQK